MSAHYALSHAAAACAISAARGGNGRFATKVDVLPAQKYGKIESLFNNSPIQQETPVLADGGFSNPSKGRDPMHELYLSYDFTTALANQIPPFLRNVGVISACGVRHE